MTLTMEVAFWGSLGVLIYGYAGYPLLVALVGRLLDRRVESAPVTPTVSLLIAAYDEEDVIAARLENALASDYPADSLEVIVASDGSTDATEEIVAGVDDDRVRLLALPRRGKAHALNEAARRARGEILVFSDANSEFEPGALRSLVRSFADPRVGGVVGHTMYRLDEPAPGSPEEPRRDGEVATEAAGRGEDLYWRYDTRLKRLESRTGSVVSAHGGLYAVRRELFRPLEDASVTDDFAISTAVVEQGRRLVFEPRARAREAPAGGSAGEFRRRVRLMTRGLRGVALRRRLLDPFRHGFYAVALFSRKVLRRLLPLVLPVLFASSVALRGESVLYAAAAGGQVVFYALAAAGWALRARPAGRSKVLYVPFFYCLANLASLVALANVLRGRRIERWSPQRDGTEPAADGGEGTETRDPRGSPPPAVVIGVDGPTGLQTARVLAGRGIPVIGIADDRRHPCARTRACREVLEADTGGPELLDVLRDLAERLGRPAVLVPCTDLSVLLLARSRGRLPAALRIVLPEPDVIETLLDKARFQALARERGYPIPVTRLVRTRSEALEASERMRFPCAVKPPVKTPLWESRTGAKVFHAATPDALLALHDRFGDAADPGLVVQEWIDGPATNHFTCNCYIGRDGDVLVDFTTRKLRQWPPEGGQASLSEECPNEEVREQTVRLFRELGHRGFGYLEMKWDPLTGRYLILEANVGRPTGRSASAEAGGVELLLTAYRDALGLPAPADRVQRFAPGRWIHLRHDLQAALALWRRGELTLAGWRRSVRGPRTCALFSWTDPLPFVADLGRTAGKLLSGGGRASSGPPPAELPPSAGEAASGAPARAGLPAPGDAVTATVDFETAAGVRVRLVEPSPGDVRAVEGAVGPPDGDRRGDPDVLIRYVDALPSTGLRLVQGGRSGYTDDDFYLLRSRSGGAVARLRVGDGEPWSEVACVRGTGRPPLLQQLVDLAALGRGWVPLHASGWIHRGVGVVGAGWDRSGKTGCLLAFGARGASFVGDDRVMIHRSGERMEGHRRPLRVRDWHLAQLPELARRAGPIRRSLSGAGRWLDGLQGRLPSARGGGGLAARALKKGLGRLRRALAVDLPPEAIFGEERCPAQGAPDAIVHLVSHDADEFRVEPVDPAELAARLAASVRAELQPLVEVGLALRFAFPERGWTLLERSADLAAALLGEAMTGKRAYVVRHPYPCSLSALYRAMEPVTETRRPGSHRTAGSSGNGDRRPSPTASPRSRGDRSTSSSGRR